MGSGILQLEGQQLYCIQQHLGVGTGQIQELLTTMQIQNNAMKIRTQRTWYNETVHSVAYYDSLNLNKELQVVPYTTSQIPNPFPSK